MTQIICNVVVIIMKCYFYIICVLVFLTWKIVSADSSCSTRATDKDWALLRGKFLLNGFPLKVVIYMEGPPPGTDILLNSFIVQHAERRPPLRAKVVEVSWPSYLGVVIFYSMVDITNLRSLFLMF